MGYAPHLPRIGHRGGIQEPLARKVTAAADVLAEHGMFTYGDVLMAQADDGIKPADHAAVRDVLNDGAVWHGRTDGRAPPEVVTALLNGQGWHSIPSVDEVTWTPRYVGGELTDAWATDAEPYEGYYWPDVEATTNYKRYGRPRYDTVFTDIGSEEWKDAYFEEKVLGRGDPTPAPVTDREVASILADLDELLQDFPWVSAADRANTLALVVTPYVAYDGPPPLALVESPGPGHGKSTLADVVLALGYPRVERIPPTALGTRRRFATRYTSAVRDAPAAVLMDNVADPVDFPELATALTSGRHSWYEDDQLYEVPVNTLHVVTVNDGDVSRELRDRSLPIHLDAEMDQPDSRRFAIPRIVQHARDRRHEFRFRAMRLVQRWVDAGEPDGEPRHGRARDWSRKVGGVLEVAGVEGFLGDDRRGAPAGRETVEDDGDGVVAFLAAANQRYGDEHVPSSELADDLADGGPLAHARPEELDADPSAVSVGMWLGARDDAPHGGYRVVKRDTRQAKGWRFERA